MTEPREPGDYQPGSDYRPGGYQPGNSYQPSGYQPGNDHGPSGYQPGNSYQPDGYQPSDYQPYSDYQFGNDYQQIGARQPDRPDTTRSRARGGAWLIAAGVLVLVVVVALVNARRGGHNTALPGPRPTSGIQLSPSAPGQQGSQGPHGLGGELLPTVSCPQIRDEQAHLAYTCIENKLAQDDSNTYLNLRIVLNETVEPNWVISEGSGDADAVVQSPSTGVIRFHQEPAGASVAQVMSKVTQRTASAVQNAYGTEPTSRTLSSKQRVFSGVLGYELVTEISINQAYRLANDLHASKERLWVVGIPTSAGVSIFMMSIPDDRSDLWSHAEAIVGSLHVI